LKILHPVDEAIWLDVARACEGATFFHTPLWHRITLTTWPAFRDATVGVVLPDGTRAVLPLVETDRHVRGLFREMASTFAGHYGGLIADRPLSEQQQRDLYREVLEVARTGEAHLTGNPCAPGPVPDGAAYVEDFTHILRLERGYDAVAAGFWKGCRTSIAKARRVGVTVRSAATLADFRAYHALYEDTLARRGTEAAGSYPWKLFENTAAVRAEQPGNVGLWLAEKDGQPVAGVLVFYWNRHAVCWHGASLASAFPHSPTNVLLAEVIRDACARGLAIFDFNPSGGHVGVARFKESFGAERLPVRRSSISRALFLGAREAARAVRR
jgi:CelD/BcsL family acetyltransferase involved in cellulose biosynthesis